jgi:hypothetical protein
VILLIALPVLVVMVLFIGFIVLNAIDMFIRFVVEGDQM